MIVLEGPDLAGKSSVAKALFQKLSDPTPGVPVPMVRHFTRLPTGFHTFWGYKSCVQRDVILDRFHMSEIVYRSTGKDDCSLTPLRYSLVDAEIARAGGLTIVIVPPAYVIKERYSAAQRPEMYDLDRILRVRDAYQSIVEKRFLMTTFGEYRVNVDSFITNAAWSVDNIASYIASLWLKRQRELNTIHDDRPANA